MSLRALSRVPWPLSLFVTLFVYAGASLISLSLPCADSLLIGLCGVGRILFVFFIFGLILLFCIYIFIQRRSVLNTLDNGEGKPVLNKRIFLAGLIFSAIPMAYTLVFLATHPDIKPLALESLQTNGREQIHFVSFSDTPVYDQSTGILTGLYLKGTIVVERAANFTIYPMRLKGLVPASTRDLGKQPAQEMQEHLRAQTPYEFAYFVSIEPIEIAGKGFGVDYVEQISQTDSFSWKVLWQVESYPPFPIYLFGIGAVARVFPDASGEFGQVTHIDPMFQTAEYPKEVFVIR